MLAMMCKGNKISPNNNAYKYLNIPYVGRKWRVEQLFTKINFVLGCRCIIFAERK